MAAYSMYELLRVLINRVGWRSESEMRAALESVDEAESMNILGNLAKMMQCKHEGGKVNGKCRDCGRGDIA